MASVLPASSDDPHTLLQAELRACRCALAESQGSPSMLSLARLLLSGSDNTHPHPDEVASLFTSAISDRTSSLPGLCALGHVFASGTRVPPSPTRAVALWRRCISSNNCIVARFFLAQARQDGAGVQGNISEAAALFEEVVDQTGSNVARVRLARILEVGADGLHPDAPRAVQLYGDAIRDGDSIEAMECLGDLYVDGRVGVEEWPREAVRLYEKAIQSGGSTRAMNSLAVLLETGAHGVQRNARRAVTLFERAVNGGNDEAMANLAFLLARGVDGVERDAKRAVMLYERAVEKGNCFAMRNLAHMIVNGEEAVEQDLSSAMELYEEVLRDGRYECGRVKVNLAWLLSCHQDVLPQDVVRAANLYEEVITEEVNGCAMYNLAGLLAEGRGGLKRDVNRAVELYQKAIDEEEDAFSMYNLGLLLSSDTEGVEKDMDRAIELLDRAAEEGLREAEFDLALILTGGEDDHAVDLDRGMELYEELVQNMDHMGAIINLSELYGQGKYGLDRDVRRAIQLSERAIVIGLGNDKEQLAELGISFDKSNPLREDNQSVEMREHAVAQRWHLVSMCNLAELLLLENGPGNLDRATRLVEKALSDPRASRALRTLTFRDLLLGIKRAVREPGAGPECNAKAARVFDVIIGRIGNTQAMRFLAEMLMQGREGVPRDVKKAINLYKRAVFNDDPQAMLTLGEILSIGACDIGVDRNGAAQLFLKILERDPTAEEAHGAVVNLAFLCSSRGSPWYSVGT